MTSTIAGHSATQPAPRDALPRLVTYQQLTEATGLSAWVFRQAVKRGELIPLTTPGRILFDLDEVLAWMRRPKRSAPARSGELRLPPPLPGSRVHW